MYKILDIRALKYNNEVVGIRIFTNWGNFDIELDVFKQKTGFDIPKLKSLKLIPHGNLLVTKDELESGVFAQEGSCNNDLFIALSNSDIIKPKKQKRELSPKEIAEKEERKRKSIASKFSYYIGFVLIDEFVDFHLKHFQDGSNLYALLNDKQEQVIKEYFRWRTKDIFDKHVGQNKTFKVTKHFKKKAEDLVRLMGTANDWYFAGSVDTGIEGSYCSLGHRIRHEYYAYSPSLKKTIVFGVKCNSDFFQIEPMQLRQMTKGHELITCEIKTIIFILNTNRHKVYKNEGYPDLLDIYKQYKDTGDSVYEDGSKWLDFMMKFDSLGLPLTKSMLEVYDVFADKYEDIKYKITLKQRTEELRKVCKENGLSDRIVSLVMVEKPSCKYYRFIQGYIVINGIDDYILPFIKQVDNIELVTQKILKYSKGLGSIDGLSGLRNKILAERNIITIDGVRRFATSEDYKSNNYSLIKTEPILGFEKADIFDNLYRALNSYFMDIPVSKKAIENSVRDFVRSVKIEKIVEGVKWVLSDEFDRDMEIILNPDRSKELPIISRESRKDVNKKTSFEPPKSKISLDIHNKHVPFGGKDKMIVETLKSAKEAGLLTGQEFVFKIVETINKSNKVSDKQRKYLVEAYNSLVK